MFRNSDLRRNSNQLSVFRSNYNRTRMHFDQYFVVKCVFMFTYVDICAWMILFVHKVAFAGLNSNLFAAKG